MKRVLEIIPGGLVWGSFLLIIIGSFVAPIWVSTFLLAYAIFWFFRTLRMSGHLIWGYFKYKEGARTNWRRLLDERLPHTSWRAIHHLVIIPSYREELETLRLTLGAIAGSDYPKNRIFAVLALEAREGETARLKARQLKREFRGKFGKFLVTFHPDSIPGEVKGKGSNITWAGKQSLTALKGLSPDHVLVTTLDADNRVSPQYLSALTYHFLTDPDPLHKSYQPIPMFFNNIWQVPLPMRMIAFGSTFWQMIESTRPYRLRNFSAHAQPLSTLKKTNFWSTETIVEDGHQFWRSYFAFGGNHKVVPMFVPIYMDAVLAGSLWETAKEQFLQKRRWAWGVSDIPYVIVESLRHREIAWTDKGLHLVRLIEGHFSWATTSLYLAIMGWAPIILNPDYRGSVLAWNFPGLYSQILTLAMVGMVASLIISSQLLRPFPRHVPRWFVLKEWLLAPLILPISNIMFGALPAIDAQTRLMLGQYLEYRVTVKKPAARRANLAIAQ